MRHALAVLSALTLAVTTAADPPSQPASTETIRLGLRGVYFVENQGQWSDAGVYYGFKTRGLDIAFRESSFTMHLAREVDSTSRAREEAGLGGPTSRAREEALLDEHRATAPLSGDAAPDAGSSDDPVPTHEYLTLTVTFPGSNDVLPEAAEPQSAKFNYYIGDDESKWASNVPSFGEVVYRNLYDGVDLHISGAPDASGVLKYEFHVQPGADYSQIHINYDGIDSLCIDDAGDLHINTTFGTLTDAAPLVWQEGSSDLSDPIPARFELDDNTTYHITLDGPVDPTRELVIDPDVEWSLYLGGEGQDDGWSVDVDEQGHIAVCGETNSETFGGQINRNYGLIDAYVVSLDADGVVQWMTFLGGSRDDNAYGVGFDSGGQIYVAGATSSPDFAGRTNDPFGSSDVYLARLAAGGELEWMRYVGGIRGEWVYRLAVAADHAIYLAGDTESPDFVGAINAIHSDRNDCFVLRADATGVVEWMRYLGGSYSDSAFGLAVDVAGNAFVVGPAYSTDFDGRRNTYRGGPADGYVLKVDARGELDWMVYLGGEGQEWAQDVDVADDGSLLVGGWTGSRAFEQRTNEHHGGNDDAYAARLDSSGKVEWMTYFGGTNDDYAYAIAADSKGGAVLTGQTESDDFVGRSNELAQGGLAIILHVNREGHLTWMAYCGGPSQSWGSDVVVDAADDALVAGGTTVDYSALLLKYRFSDGLRLSVSPSCPQGGRAQLTWSNATPCTPAALLFARSTGSFTIPNNRPCPGTMLGLGTQQIRNVFTGNSDPNGNRTLNANAGPGACGGYLQLLDLTTCATSNVARIE